MSKKKKRKYKVGYAKPPKATRFKKGQSGNPNGRPRRMVFDFEAPNTVVLPWATFMALCSTGEWFEASKGQWVRASGTVRPLGVFDERVLRMNDGTMVHSKGSAYMANDLDRVLTGVRDNPSPAASIGVLLGNISNLLKTRGDTAAEFGEMLAKNGKTIIDHALANTEALAHDIARGYRPGPTPNPATDGVVHPERPVPGSGADIAGMSSDRPAAFMSSGTESGPGNQPAQTHPVQADFDAAKTANTAAGWNAFIAKYEGPDNRPGGLVDLARQARAKIR